MVAVTTRAGKGSPLTNAEIDANWNALVADLNTKMTQAQARAAISVSGSLTYNSTTGVLGFTETPLTSANIVAALGFTPLSNAGGTLSGGLTVTGDLLLAANSGSSRIVGFGSGTNTSLVLQAGAATGTGANLELMFDKYAYLDADETRLRSNDAATIFLTAKSAGVNVVTGALTQQGNQVLHASNYNSYAPTLTGGGASGTWGISISGNSAYASSAGNADTVDGYHSASFLRSVNGAGPDANGNATVNVDLSSRVAKTGDTMTGALTLPGMTVSSTAPTVDLADTSTGRTRKLHHNDDLMGFLKTDGNWDMYTNNSGQMWTANYGWLHDYFFSSVSNCGWNVAFAGNAGNCLPANPINCYGSGNQFTTTHEILDNGSQIQLRSVRYNYNCNCNCDCC
ncbi:MAG: hypothetical protein E6R03_16855 [Hyphomicrobiaceae bacterium]|nr:MAG: hypothetical protein E6R03_16855 [Hyphomicrobiaceae bacterium]